ncbi:TetR/AcrR family transcriptional regulator [Sporomusa acidovorans]|uniref:HTH tetR-type domain-containing protein n=1 Tax=Sporomusa acidovorans (strain ATCC 49682 / DSM 3132 / Mol) TaxID=1123286 RepID=A0ABZ3J6D5_SPOA4|nr:TetR/AcrR family transcriptional regulator [Sporomusa acidovorans]OZC18258.1 biofilm operon icaADBC HTH-type negative transcriptional regulator IcaR [Sporomusa acidovorans DSM 3132]SDF26049.1 transcriptional regulator, TetR family [Sporomusa acidovorans]
MSKQTKDRVKEVARVLFAVNGYDATTMDQIAAGVGIKKPTLYAYISSKEELFLSIYSELENDYRSYMEQVIAETEGMAPPERLYYLFKQYIIYSTRDMETAILWNRILFFPPAFLKDELASRVFSNEMQLGRKLMAIIREGIDQGLLRKAPPEEVLFAYYSLREGVLALLLAFKRPEEENARRVDIAWQNFWFGIKEK